MNIALTENLPYIGRWIRADDQVITALLFGALVLQSFTPLASRDG